MSNQRDSLLSSLVARGGGRGRHERGLQVARRFLGKYKDEQRIHEKQELLFASWSVKRKNCPMERGRWIPSKSFFLSSISPQIDKDLRGNRDTARTFVNICHERHALLTISRRREKPIVDREITVVRTNSPRDIPLWPQPRERERERERRKLLRFFMQLTKFNVTKSDRESKANRERVRQSAWENQEKNSSLSFACSVEVEFVESKEQWLSWECGGEGEDAETHKGSILFQSYDKQRDFRKKIQFLANYNEYSTVNYWRGSRRTHLGKFIRIQFMIAGMQLYSLYCSWGSLHTSSGRLFGFSVSWRHLYKVCTLNGMKTDWAEILLSDWQSEKFLYKDTRIAPE